MWIKRFLLCLGLVSLLALSPATAVGTLTMDGIPLEAAVMLYQNTTYVSLEAVTKALSPGASVRWTGSSVVAEGEGFTLTARAGDCYLEVNGRALYVPHGILPEGGELFVPVRVLADALGAQVDWDASTGMVELSSTGEESPTWEEVYPMDALYWLSKIISAESRGEPLAGKIAVGNVILNRVESDDFPSTIYGVIFDDRWGGQFEPARSGTIYLPPTQESILAAKLVLEGADVAGESLYFLSPSLAGSDWIMEEREYVMTIGAHWFYQ